MTITTASGYTRPSLSEWLALAQAAYAAKFGTFTESGTFQYLSEIDSVLAHTLAGYIEAEAQSFFPWLATGQRLLDWGDFLLGEGPNAAGTATGTATFTATATDATIAVGQIVTSAAGVEYSVTTAGSYDDGVIAVGVTCAVSGTSGNLATGSTLTLQTPIAGVTSAGTVASPGLTGGTAAETTEEYRARVVARIQTPPAGGNDNDYITWAKEVDGVTRAWVVRGTAGTGEVLVLFVMDSTYDNGIPVGDGAPGYSGDLLTVYTYIYEQAPAPAVLYVAGPTPVAINYVIHGLDPDTTAVRAAIEAELKDLHTRKASPGTTWRWSWGAEAVALAAGADSFSAIEPTTNTAIGTREIAVLGTVTYVSD